MSWFRRKSPSEPSSIDEVRRSEIEALSGSSPGPSSVGDLADETNLVGLAFSGGGIRSATFNLGILQGLAKLGILRRFDFLSTVSGGGYIGTWLQGWMHAARKPGVEPIEVVEERLRKEAEPPEVRFLREHSNYLTPRMGLMSADTWSIASIYLRNLLLNLLVMVLAIGGACFLLRSVTTFYGVLEESPWLTLVMSVAGVLAAVAGAVANMTVEPKSVSEAPFYVKRAGVVVFVVAPLLIACWAASAYAHGRSERLSVPEISKYWVVFAATYLFAMSVPALARWLWRRREVGAEPVGIWDVATIALATVVAGAVSAALFFGYAYWISSHGGPEAFQTYRPVIGPLALILCVGVVMALNVGMAGSALSEQLREWQARMAALLVGLGVLIALGCTLVLCPRTLVDWRGLEAVAVPGWLATVAGTLWAQRGSPSAQSSAAGVVRRLLIAVGPYVFVAGFLVVVALAADAFATEVMGHDPSVQSPTDAASHLVMGFGLVLGALALSVRFGVNDFSIASLYRNRLVRCYLGAIRRDERVPNLFTGFDERDDDIELGDLDRQSKEDIDGVGHELSICRPYIIYNATLNLVGGDKLAWQRRKARPFVFTPKYCGFALSEKDGELGPGARYALRPSKAYAGGISLGTAMSISGAAVSPSMGDRTTPALAFLLTVFNLRLGRWLPNPKHKIWEHESPKLGLLLLVKELLGLTRDEQRYVYLSDGGHFENLGLYELVRRRCRFIVVCDAGQDPERSFDDLGNAIERIRTDLDVDIEINVEPLELDDRGRSRERCAVGIIDYDAETQGILIYVKATLTGNEPIDIHRYVRSHPGFPHESTADQWFDESQFECYRRLGERTAHDVFGAVGDLDLLARMSDEQLFVHLRKRWHARSPNHGHFSRHTEELNRITRSIRADGRLAFLAIQLFPEFWQLEEKSCHAPDAKAYALPADPEALRAGFYICNEIIQLMENVYLDLDLETLFDHPDHRGWLNLFRHWTWSSMFRATWAICASTFGARFQLFCERQFELGPMPIAARMTLDPDALKRDDESLRAETGLNFRELERLRIICDVAPDADALRIIPLAVRVECPAASMAGVPPVIDLNCAVAAVEGDRLVYLRVQDHVRKMGLGRRCLETLLEDGLIAPDLDGLRDFGRRAPPELAVTLEEVTRDRYRLLRMLESAIRERAPAPREVRA